MVLGQVLELCQSFSVLDGDGSGKLPRGVYRQVFAQLGLADSDIQAFLQSGVIPYTYGFSCIPGL